MLQLYLYVTIITICLSYNCITVTVIRTNFVIQCYIMFNFIPETVKLQYRFYKSKDVETYYLLKNMISLKYCESKYECSLNC